MVIYRLEQFIGGWFIGNFEPSIFKSETFEVSVKNFSKGTKEAKHFQNVATEITVVCKGKILICNRIVNVGEIIVIEPKEICDFEALEDSILVCVKYPSIPADMIKATR